jgi:ATP-dependent 26S proteasome regulatory subunit
MDRKIEFPPPSPKARLSILCIHSRKVRVVFCPFFHFIEKDAQMLL